MVDPEASRCWWSGARGAIAWNLTTVFGCRRSRTRFGGIVARCWWPTARTRSLRGRHNRQCGPAVWRPARVRRGRRGDPSACTDSRPGCRPAVTRGFRAARSVGGWRWTTGPTTRTRHGVIAMRWWLGSLRRVTRAAAWGVSAAAAIAGGGPTPAVAHHKAMAAASKEGSPRLRGQGAGPLRAPGPARRFPSPTHTISGAVIGRRAAKALSAVRWGVAGTSCGVDWPSGGRRIGAAPPVTRLFGPARRDVVVSVLIVVGSGCCSPGGPRGRRSRSLSAFDRYRRLDPRLGGLVCDVAGSGDGA